MAELSSSLCFLEPVCGIQTFTSGFCIPPQCGITFTDQYPDSFTKHIPLNPDLLYKVGFILALLLMNSLSSARF